MEVASIIFQQICTMFLIVAVGVILYKVNIITDKGSKQLSNLVLNLVCPVLIFMAYQTDYNSEILPNIAVALALSAVTHIILVVLSMIFIRKKSDDISIERFSIVYSNCAFMGIPLIGAIFGSEGVLNLTAYITFFNFFVWTHGVIIMRGTGGIYEVLRALRSPSVVAIFLGLLCFITGFRLPLVLSGAFSHIANMNTPLAMLVAGATVAKTNIIKAVTNKRVLYISLLRLVITPLILVPFYKMFSSGDVFITLSVAAACPVAATGTLFAVSYDKNSTLASEIFAVSTVLSAVTLPIIVVFANFIG